MMSDAKKTVLIVEDDKDICWDLHLLLSSEGYEVLMASNGQEALAILEKQKPSVVLLDIMMPVMDGWQFRAEQTKDPRIAQIPVVVMTADGHAPQKAAKMNAQGWVQKPIDIDLLLSAVAKHA